MTRTDWQPPSEFDQIRELNSQGGRLTTLYGLLLTAYTFSTGSEPVRSLLVSIYTLRLSIESVLLLINLVIGLGSFVLGFNEALTTMQPAVPSEQRQDAYVELRNFKVTSAAFSGSLILVCLLAFLASWSTVAAIPVGDPRLDGLTLITATLLTGLNVTLAVGMLIRHRKLMRQRRLW